MAKPILDDELWQILAAAAQAAAPAISRSQAA